VPGSQTSPIKSCHGAAFRFLCLGLAGWALVRLLGLWGLAFACSLARALFFCWLHCILGPGTQQTPGRQPYLSFNLPAFPVHCDCNPPLRGWLTKLPKLPTTRGLAGDNCSSRHLSPRPCPSRFDPFL
jgi:hypothetical protein